MRRAQAAGNVKAPWQGAGAASAALPRATSLPPSMLAPPPLPRTVEASFRDLDASRPQSRMSCIEDLTRHALRDQGVRARAIPLIEKALRDEIPGVRSTAAVALADLRAKEALPGLLIAIEDVDAYVRQMALSALGEIGDARAAPRLRRALSDTRPEVRYQAVIAYVRVLSDDPTEALRALVDALGDADDSVRYIALRLVEERVDAGSREGLDDVLVRAEAMLTAPPPHVAVVAAIVLAKLGNKRAKALIRRVVDGSFKLPRGPAQEDEREAVELAGALGLRDTIPALERRAFGLKHLVADTCAYSATIALARLGHERARAELLRGLRSPKRATCEASVVAVGRARLREARPIVAGLTANDADPDLIARSLEELTKADEAVAAEPPSAPSTGRESP
jgi:HEAT repeat protein